MSLPKTLFYLKPFIFSNGEITYYNTCRCMCKHGSSSSNVTDHDFIILHVSICKENLYNHYLFPSFQQLSTKTACTFRPKNNKKFRPKKLHVHVNTFSQQVNSKHVHLMSLYYMYNYWIPLNIRRLGSSINIGFYLACNLVRPQITLPIQSLCLHKRRGFNSIYIDQILYTINMRGRNDINIGALQSHHILNAFLQCQRKLGQHAKPYVHSFIILLFFCPQQSLTTHLPLFLILLCLTHTYVINSNESPIILWHLSS